MVLNKKQLLASDIISFLKDIPDSNVDDLYDFILQKHRTHITRNKFYSTLMEMKRKGFVIYDDSIVSLNEEFKGLPEKEIFIKFINRWPSDLMEGLI